MPCMGVGERVKRELGGVSGVRGEKLKLSSAVRGRLLRLPA